MILIQDRQRALGAATSGRRYERSAASRRSSRLELIFRLLQALIRVEPGMVRAA